MRVRQKKHENGEVQVLKKLNLRHCGIRYRRPGGHLTERQSEEGEGVHVDDDDDACDERNHRATDHLKCAREGSAYHVGHFESS